MGKRIDQLDPYGSYDDEKSSGDIYEVSKNSGTSGSPIYAEGDSRRERADELAAKLARISVPYFVLMSPDGHRWKVTIDNTGEFTKEDLGI